MSSKDYVTTGEVMTPSPKMVHGLSTVQEAIEIMRENVISSVVVERRQGCHWRVRSGERCTIRIVMSGRAVVRAATVNSSQPNSL